LTIWPAAPYVAARAAFTRRQEGPIFTIDEHGFHDVPETVPTFARVAG
jgi:hypothetical protein